mgnify:CR=1 FL=1
MMKTLIEVERRISTLKAAKAENAKNIKDLEEQNEVINLELEKALIKKGEVTIQKTMKEYFRDEH